MRQRVGERIAVIGLGEVGKPIYELAERSGALVLGVDVQSSDLPTAIDVMHVCFPYDNESFVDEVTRYSHSLEPALTIINSTVAVGTTRSIHAHIGRPIVYSPVRGKHSRMVQELTVYQKYVGGIDDDAAAAAAAHFQRLHMQTRLVSTPEAAELAKLTETTYFGLLIAWAQEVERYCDLEGLDYDEVVSFYDEISFFPPTKYVPGVIGGHCVMPNIEILARLKDSDLLRAIRSSNKKKTRRDEPRESSAGPRVRPPTSASKASTQHGAQPRRAGHKGQRDAADADLRVARRVRGLKP